MAVDETRPIRVLVADNQRAIREGIRAAVSPEPDMQVVGEAEEGNAALRLAIELRPHVLVLDLAMPGVGGLEVVRALTPVLPEVRIVVFSCETWQRTSALAAGAAAFVTKDAPDRELLDEIRRVAPTHRVASDRSSGKQRLGEYLLAHGLITAAQLDAALAWQRDLAKRGESAKLGELLRALGAISAADLERALRREAEGLV